MSVGRAPASRTDASFGLALRLGLLVLVLDASYYWFERVPVLAFAGAGLLWPRLARAPWLWAGLLLLVSGYLVWNWPFSDNHDYLVAFLCLAVLCALATPDPPASLATSARALLGVLFLFATLWKLVLSPDFVDGSFFRITLLTDSRFETLAALAGGLGYEAWEANTAALEDWLAGRSGWRGFVEPVALRRFAYLATAATGLLEALVAAAFLWPRDDRFARARHALLLLFAASTYAFATVRGFGWLLMTLGVAQCEPARRRTRVAYVAVFLLIEIYRSVPWDDALVARLGLD